jgi:hypothetical protein
MKRLMITILLVLMTSLSFGEITVPTGVYDHIPQELQGVWYSKAYVGKKGRDEIHRPLFKVSRNYMSTSQSTYKIESVRMFVDGLDFIYVFQTHDPSVRFVLIWAARYRPAVRELYGFVDKTESFRSIIEIVRSEE